MSEEHLHDLCRDALSTKAGERFVDKLEELFVFRRSFQQGDPHVTSFKEGQRDVALMIIQMARSKE